MRWPERALLHDTLDSARGGTRTCMVWMMILHSRPTIDRAWICAGLTDSDELDDLLNGMQCWLTLTDW
jgi:hypothetical protein